MIEPYYDRGGITIFLGDCRNVLPQLEAGSMDMAVTSPPYWGLRNYGVDGQIGLEPSVDEYVAELVAVFREVRRLLKDSGTLWLNLGDAYSQASTHGGGNKRGPLDSIASLKQHKGLHRKYSDGLKPKDLIGLPWRLAFALQADGWWLRSEITWCKRAPMPESVTDRPTSATEKIFLFAKAERYYYDAEAVKEESTMRPQNRYTDGRGTKDNGYREDRRAPGMTAPASRNMRNFWLLRPEPFPEAHFATFPTEIPKRAILAGTSERGYCGACGKPWERVVERTDIPDASAKGSRFDAGKTAVNGQGRTQPGERYVKAATGWQPSCQCEAGTVPGVVLDPFLGAGTTALVAKNLGRRCVGVELNPDYIGIAERRLRQDVMTFETAE